MGFQITTKLGEPIHLDELNREVAKLWGKHYISIIGTKPFPNIDSQFSYLFEGEVWAEFILKVIEYSPCYDWEELRETIKHYITDGCSKNEDKYFYINYNKVYFDMINHFEKLGYMFIYVPPEDENLII